MDGAIHLERWPETANSRLSRKRIGTPPLRQVETRHSTTRWNRLTSWNELSFTRIQRET